MNIELHLLDRNIKLFLRSFLILLTFGVSVGLAYLYYTTNYSVDGAVTRYKGSELNDADFEIADNYPKPVSEMLVTTHNHLIAFALIFLSVGSIFYFNSIIKGFWKTFLMVEPLLSTIVTFSSIWAVRFISPHFIYLTIISSILIYISFYIMVSICIYDLTFNKKNKKTINPNGFI